MIWRKRLADMLVGRAKLNPKELADHNHCRLGKWYNGAGAALRDAAPYKDIAAPHAKVHELGIAAAEAYQQGNIQEAIKLVGMIETPSRAVQSCLDELIRAVSAIKPA